MTLDAFVGYIERKVPSAATGDTPVNGNYLADRALSDFHCAAGGRRYERVNINALERVADFLGKEVHYDGR